MNVIKVGIGIINYNRADLLDALLVKLKETVDLDCELVVADDSSSDNSLEICDKNSIEYVTGENRGIAWNKNRALYYLMNYTQSDIVILMENDCELYDIDWLNNWRSAVSQHGHLNCLHPSTQDVLFSGGSSVDILGGEGTASDPYQCTKISGICIGSTRELINKVGYLDTRFKGYGHEHSEWTLRFRRTGHGYVEKEGIKLNLMISGGVTAVDTPSSSNKEMIQRNRKVMDECKKDGLYRHPWRSEKERADLLSEMNGALYRKVNG